MTRHDVDHWTPTLVEEAMIEAATWLRRTGPAAGPSGFVTVLMRYRPTMEDHLAEGWGLPEPPDEEPRLTLAASRRQVARYEAALQWPARILLPIGRETEARALNLWVAHKAGAGSWGRLLKERSLGRAAANAARDRALSLISMRLEKEGLAPWRTTL